jgi:hypothetical protein
MKSRTAQLAFLTLVAFAASGCGTLCNFGAYIVHVDGDKLERPAIYGGLQIDAAVVDSVSRSGGINPGSGTNAIWTICFGFAEFTATFIGDTLTLPITGLVQEYRLAHRPPQNAQTSQSEPATEIKGEAVSP